MDISHVQGEDLAGSRSELEGTRNRNKFPAHAEEGGSEIVSIKFETLNNCANNQFILKNVSCKFFKKILDKRKIEICAFTKIIIFFFNNATIFYYLSVLYSKV